MNSELRRIRLEAETLCHTVKKNIFEQIMARSPHLHRLQQKLVTRPEIKEMVEFGAYLILNYIWVCMLWRR